MVGDPKGVRGGSTSSAGIKLAIRESRTFWVCRRRRRGHEKREEEEDDVNNDQTSADVSRIAICRPGS